MPLSDRCSHFYCGKYLVGVSDKAAASSGRLSLAFFEASFVYSFNLQVRKTAPTTGHRCRANVCRLSAGHNTRPRYVEVQLSAGAESHRPGVDGESSRFAGNQLSVASIVSVIVVQAVAASTG